MSNSRPENEYDVYIEKDVEMTWEEIGMQVCDEIDASIRFQKQHIVPQRTLNWDRYYGRPFGNEQPGRSKYMSRDLLETVEWILPNLIKLFASADHKIKLRLRNTVAQEYGLTPEQLGMALMGQIYKDLYSDESMGLFMVLYTWFKDALVSGSAYVKLFWEVDMILEDFEEMVDQDQFAELANMPEVTIATAQVGPTGQMLVKGQVERASKDNLVCDNIPHWEFIFEEHTRSMNDDTGKGFTTVVTLDYLRRINQAYSKDDEKYFWNLDMVEASAGKDGSYINFETESERKRFFDYAVLNDYVGAQDKGAKRRVQLTEWYTRIDVNGDGFLEDVKVYKANGLMIRWELNEANFVPCAKISPIIDVYHFQGIAYADLIVELQELKSMLMRKTLDNYDFQNSGRWFIKPGATIDEERFLEGIPGDVFRANPDHVKNFAPSGFDASSLSLIEYVEGIKENRTGSTRYNQGTDASSLNQTAHGIQTIMNASMKRIELIGQLFAEGGLKDFFVKAAKLYQKNITEPFTARVDGEEVEISPEMIKGAKIEAYVDLGTEDQAGQIESQRLLQMSAVLFDLNTKFPGIITPVKARAIAVKYVSAMGFNADSYISSKNEFEAATQQAQQMQETVQQMQMMLEQMKIQIEQKGVDVKEIAAYGEIAAAQEALKVKLMIANAQLKQKDGEGFRTQRVDLAKTIMQIENSNSNQATKQPA